MDKLYTIRFKAYKFVFLVYFIGIGAALNWKDIGVVDYYPDRSPTYSSGEIKEKNIENLEQIMHDAYYQDLLNMIIFPDYGLTTDECEDTYFPAAYGFILPKSFEIPLCMSEDVDMLLNMIGCVADKYKMYLVIGIIEIDDTEDVWLYYYTTLVINDKGAISNSYRKKQLTFNLNPHNEYTKGNESIDITNTEKFGNFTVLPGWDFLFTDSKQIANLDYIIFSSTLKSYWPFLHGPSLEAAFAKRNKVTVVASSLKNTTLLYGGGGIYTENFVLTKANDRGIIKSNLENLTNNAFNTFKDDMKYPSISFNGEDICLEDVDENQSDCIITVEPKELKTNYKKATCLKNHSFNITNEYIQVCSLVYCPDKTLCNFSNFNEEHGRIKELSVKLKQDESSITIQSLPLTLYTNLMPSNNFSYSENNTEISMSRNQIESDLLVFGILLIKRKVHKKTTEMTHSVTDNSKIVTEEESRTVWPWVIVSILLITAITVYYKKEIISKIKQIRKLVSGNENREGRSTSTQVDEEINDKNDTSPM